MDGWEKWMDVKVFLRLKNGRVYSGVINEVDDTGNEIIFLSLKDKFGKNVTISTSEIIEIKEEGE